jgi:hypothetical protein
MLSRGNSSTKHITSIDTIVSFPNLGETISIGSGGSALNDESAGLDNGCANEKCILEMILIRTAFLFSESGNDLITI